MNKIIRWSLGIAVLIIPLLILAATQRAPLVPNSSGRPVKQHVYIERNGLKPVGLEGISQDQIDDHWKLYQGYVKNVNELNAELAQLRAQGKGSSLVYADRRRRYGFEYNGMVLHEYYFENLGKPTDLDLKNEVSIDLRRAIERDFGSYDAWKQDFENTGKTRGIGWALLVVDTATDQLLNLFVEDHQTNNIAGFKVLLAMDVWEHAYMVDHQAGGRGDYITAFVKNINWDVVNKRHLEHT